MEASAAQQPKTTRQEPSISPQLHRSHSLSHSNSHSLQHHISPDYSHTFNQNPNANTNPNPLSNLPPSLQQHHTQGSSRLPDDIWLAPPLDGDNGIGLSGVGDNRLWFNNGGSGGFNLGDISSNTGRHPLDAACRLLTNNIRVQQQWHDGRYIRIRHAR
jgi:hypothetical protein